MEFREKTKRLINKKFRIFYKKSSYKANAFNDNIIKIIEENFDQNIESKLFENIIPNKKNIREFFGDKYNHFEKVIIKILNSKAAIDFFHDHYQVKYNNLKYHFNDPTVQKEILNKIIFAPIYNKNCNGITDPTCLNIIINAIPEEYTCDVPIYNLEILQFGKLVISTIHEILGHYLRRYYSFLTGKLIAFNTLDYDNDIYTGTEGGIYIEEKFLGINFSKTITIKNALLILFWEGFTKYPILEKKDVFNINENILKIIIEGNRCLFSFIKEDNKINNEVPVSSTLTIKEYIDLHNLQ